MSIDWFKGKITGTSHISWEILWFPSDFPLSQPIENGHGFNSYSGLGSGHRPSRQVCDEEPYAGLPRWGNDEEIWVMNFSGYD